VVSKSRNNGNDEVQGYFYIDKPSFRMKT